MLRDIELMSQGLVAAKAKQSYATEESLNFMKEAIIDDKRVGIKRRRMNGPGLHVLWRSCKT